MNNKILVKLLLPETDDQFDIFVPINIRIGTLISLLNRSLIEVTNGAYTIKKNRKIYNVENGKEYQINSLVRETNIRNGSSIVFI